MSDTIRTAEFVSPKHPDKTCDQMADAILDTALAQDVKTRAGIEVMGGHGVITVNGEMTTTAKLDIPSIVRSVAGDQYQVKVEMAQQSPQIAQGVDTGGAGDQGIMMGYATSETDNHMPREYHLARLLCRTIFEKHPYDGKTQVTLEGDRVKTVLTSFQNVSHDELERIARATIEAEEYLINPAGDWDIGSFDADAGLTGRKIIVDNYGPEVQVGGGCFSGKDYTKVDRSAAYMARKIALDYLKKKGASVVRVKLAYAIGKKEPVMAVAEIDGTTEKVSGYDLSPAGIRDALDLARPIYRETSMWGHFGNGFSWDQ